MKWGEFLKKRRAVKYRSAREFCAQHDLGISYPQYSRYEAGDQLPNLEQAIVVFRLLEIPLLEGLLEWCQVQVADSDSQRQIGEFLAQARSAQGTPKAEAPVRPVKTAEGGDVTRTTGVSLDDVIVLNRSHLRLLCSKEPVYRDIFTYVYVYAPDWISLEEVSIAFEIPVESVRGFFKELVDLGVLVEQNGLVRPSKTNCYFPDDADFYELRNLNFTHNVNQIMRRLTFDDLKAGASYRNLITRELSPRQIRTVIEGIEGLFRTVVGLAERPEPGAVHSLCVVLGERFSRVRTPRPGLKSQPKDPSPALERRP